MKRITAFFAVLLSRIIGRKNTEGFLIYCLKSIGANIHVHGLLQIGAGTGAHLENGGELFFIKKVLPQLIDHKKPVFFDVGANIGDYTNTLKEYFPGAYIYAFEPVQSTFGQLQSNVGSKANLFNIGFGSECGTGLLYNSADDAISEITTTHKEVLVDIFRRPGEIISLEFTINTIDNFCHEHDINHVDFIKIDVEGYELAVLNGAIQTLQKESIKVIQFEFNSHNIYAKVFLRDFYKILDGYAFFRLTGAGIIPLGDYKVMNEIFTMQNLVAINKGIVNKVDSRYLINL